MLPKGYKKDIPRVSNIISFIKPFKGTEGERRYLDWLKSKNIEEKEFLEASQELGTFVHLQLENYINGVDIDIENPLYKETKDEIRHGTKLIDKVSDIQTEIYIRDGERFQGSCDLIYEDDDGNIVLADWKSWGINKSRFGLPNKFLINTDKKLKVQLQLSFYAYGLRKNGVKIDKIQLLYLHKEGLKIVDLDIIPDSEIEHYLDLYEASLEDKDINILLPNIDNMFEIELKVPTVQFGYVSVKFDLKTLDNGETAQDNIKNALTTVKTLAENLKDK